MIKTCPLCNMNTAGQHEWDCPNMPNVVSITAGTIQDDSVVLDQSVRQQETIAELQSQLATAEEKNKRLREIVEIIMTQHWDMAACQCWVCTKGREAGCSPMEKYLPMRKKGSGHGRVTVEQALKEKP